VTATFRQTHFGTCKPFIRQACVLWRQDVKGSMDDEPLKACVASGGISYVRKIANEQDMLRDMEQPREATSPIADAGGESCEVSGDDADLDRCGADMVEPASDAFHDDVDCLEMDL
jgi:hypothetical protein